MLNLSTSLFNTNKSNHRHIDLLRLEPSRPRLPKTLFLPNYKLAINSFPPPYNQPHTDHINTIRNSNSRSRSEGNVRRGNYNSNIGYKRRGGYESFTRYDHPKELPPKPLSKNTFINGTKKYIKVNHRVTCINCEEPRHLKSESTTFVHCICLTFKTVISLITNSKCSCLFILLG